MSVDFARCSGSWPRVSAGSDQPPPGNSIHASPLLPQFNSSRQGRLISVPRAPESDLRHDLALFQLVMTIVRVTGTQPDSLDTRERAPQLTAQISAFAREIDQHRLGRGRVIGRNIRRVQQRGTVGEHLDARRILSAYDRP